MKVLKFLTWEKNKAVINIVRQTKFFIEIETCFTFLKK
jgi:hypothetical protein